MKCKSIICFCFSDEKKEIRNEDSSKSENSNSSLKSGKKGRHKKRNDKYGNDHVHHGHDFDDTSYHGSSGSHHHGADNCGMAAAAVTAAHLSVMEGSGCGSAHGGGGGGGGGDGG